MFDVRTDLERLPDPNLFDIGRNLDAAHRLLAIRILLNRGSNYIDRPEIAQDAKQLLDDEAMAAQPPAAQLPAETQGRADWWKERWSRLTRKPDPAE
jgi:hypothetical protein